MEKSTTRNTQDIGAQKMSIQNEINGCNKCGKRPKLTESSMQIGNSRILIIGESPAKDGWIISGRAFFNSSGKLQATGRVLEKLLGILGLSIADIFFTECCKCIIDSRSELKSCSENCLPFLKKQIVELPCDIVLTMGHFPSQALLGQKIDRFSDYVGRVFDMEIGEKRFSIIPIFHTSPLNPKGFSGNIPVFEKIKILLQN